MNQKELPVQSNPVIDAQTAEKAHQLTWHSVKLRKGDVVTVLARSHSNRKIPEAGAPGDHAWSRARWKSLQLVE